MEYLTLIGYALLLCCGMMTLTWFIANKIDNYSIVDITWSYNFPLLAALLFFTGPGIMERKLLMLICVAVWGYRLGTHLLIRILGHLHQEDGRYLEMRKKWSKNIKANFFSFYQMQAASNVFLAIPFFVMAVNSSEGIALLEWIGLGIWIIALLGESVADKQLANFKKDSANKGKVCNVGLWAWSRHPNYFFEFTIWVGFATMASASPYGWLAWLSPASILFLLLRVTGIPMTEEQAVRSKGEAYLAYQRTTSKFIPLPPKSIR